MEKGILVKRIMDRLDENSIYLRKGWREYDEYRAVIKECVLGLLEVYRAEEITRYIYAYNVTLCKNVMAEAWDIIQELRAEEAQEAEEAELKEVEAKVQEVEVEVKTLQEVFEGVLELRQDGIQDRKIELMFAKERINEALNEGTIEEGTGYAQLKTCLDELKILNMILLDGKSLVEAKEEIAKEIANRAWKEASKKFEEALLRAAHKKEVQELREATCFSSNNVLELEAEIEEKGEIILTKELRVFEAFAGVGAQRMALRNLNIPHKVVGIAEIDKYALNSYEAIHGECPNYGDITKIDPTELPDMDLFTYSFPCQDLSVAGYGKGLGKGTRSGLLYECEKIIEVKKPKYLLLENVKNLVSNKFKPKFDEWLNYLEGLGYTNYWQVLNAKDFKVPQNRERVFVVSILDDEQGFEFPKGYYQTKSIRDILEPEHEIDKKRYYYGDYRQFRIDNFDEGIINSSPKDEPKRNEVYKIGEFTDSNFKQCLALIGVNGVSRCLLTSYYHNNIVIKEAEGYKVRRITPKETWRLMGFTDEDYNKASKVTSLNQLYRQSGNSICVPVLEGIFGNLFFKSVDK